MLASVTHKFVLLSNPKCGTTALERAYVKHAEIRLYGAEKWKHISYRGLTDMFGDYFQRQGCDIFVTIRHPLDTLQSWFRYRSREELAAQGARTSTAGMSFAEFCAEWAGDKPKARSRMTSQREFLMDEAGGLPDLRIYDYSALPQLVADLNQRLGKPVELEAVNVSPRMTLEVDETALAASEKYQRELAFYEQARARAITG